VHRYLVENSSIWCIEEVVDHYGQETGLEYNFDSAEEYRPKFMENEGLILE